MNRDELTAILPHRGNMLLLDSMEQTALDAAQGTYSVRGDEWFLDGHFPGNPIVPGVMLCEMIAQASCILMREALKGKTPLYAGMNNVRFRRQVKPGDALTLKTRMIRHKMGVFIVAGEAYVGEELCCNGDFTFMLV